MIRAAVPADAALAAGLALRLWPGHTEEELTAEMAELISSSEAVIFIAFEECRAVGFAQVQLRRDYVEGTTSSPVGYLEGIYVEETYRRRGIASHPVSYTHLDVYKRQGYTWALMILIRF